MVIPLMFFSCEKQEFETNPPIPPTKVKSDTIKLISDVYTLSGQKWILNAYRIGEYGAPIKRNDTLFFISKIDCKYNNSLINYTLTPALSTFTLTLNSTFLGDLSGTIFEYNIKNGLIEGLKFKDISLGNNSNSSYYLWLNKI
jgi:hypothetical protein